MQKNENKEMDGKEPNTKNQNKNLPSDLFDDSDILLSLSKAEMVDNYECLHEKQQFLKPYQH